MRFLVFLLLLINIGLFAYFNTDKWMPKTQVAYVELNAKKIKVLTDKKDFEELIQKDAAYVSVAPQPITTCYQWGNFTSANLSVAQAVLARLALQADVKQSADINADKRFWIYHPPLKTAKASQIKVEEMKRLGVEELYIVQDSKWRNAISFGLFSEEALANNLLKALKAKGVRNVVKALRSANNVGSSLLIKDVSPEVALRLYKIVPEFVGTKIRPAACLAT